MMDFFRRLNAMFISLVLVFVYGIGVGLARLIYIFSATKQISEDSYWIPADKTRTPDELSAPY